MTEEAVSVMNGVEAPFSSERFIEDGPATLQCSSEPITADEEKQADAMFTWIDQH